MLIKCPECDLQVSDKAPFCPHCGYVLKDETKTRLKRTKNKRRRLPNGFGQISEIKGQNLRKPFRAMVTVGKTGEGKPICKLLKPDAYFETYNEAYAALVDYNKNPYDLNAGLTANELFEKWIVEYEKSLSYSNNSSSYKKAWLYCSTIHGIRASDIRARHIKGCIDEGFIIHNNERLYANPTTKFKIKSLFNLMLDYALEYEIVDKNYARTFALPSKIRKEAKETISEHIAYTDEEMEKLWENVDDIKFVDAVLIQCYSGWRPKELCLLELDKINLEEWTFTGGMKTDAGKDRTVPIHPKIRDLVKRRYDEAKKINSKYLFNIIGARGIKEFNYDRYRRGLKKIIENLSLNPDHRLHDARKHFVTMAKKFKVEEYAIKYIVGHSIVDLTERVYTQRDFNWLREELEKIK